MIVFLGLGTNIGNRTANLKQALKRLEEAGLRLEKVSSVYETEPIGVEDQGWFYNMVLEAKTELSPQELLKTVKNIEKEMGRVPAERWGPRLIDIDLLMYDGLETESVSKNGHLKLPHPELKNRAFVLVPLLEIEPQATLPNGRPLKRFLEHTRGQKVKKLESTRWGLSPSTNVGDCPRKDAENG